ncbi:MAG TPA: DnaB-like helicase C-terminal domain-containing protein [Actinomycetota bacterium]|nr:DnaB-like helicase C-terminal domain-containing protein [Actinomycetota bacterium]
MGQNFQGLGPAEQLEAWRKVATDPRPRAASGIAPLDDLLNRRSFGPGELVILGGRMHTRKTGVACNIIVNLLKAGVPVGLVGLDESPAMYVAKLASVMSGVAHTTLGESWETPRMAKIRDEYTELAKNLSVTKGYRPSFETLTGWLDTADVTAARPRVVVIDYLSLLARARYTKGEAERVQRLTEDLQVWTNDNEVTTIALHQVGRSDDTNQRYHGDSPMMPEQLMYGGEATADIILSTFRPTLEPIGNMTEKQALAEGIDQEEWEAKRELVDEYRDITMLQLTKNRPGVELLYRGLKLRSAGHSQRMVPVESSVDDDMVREDDEDAA